MKIKGYPEAAEALRASPRRWLVTGAAGFIGSNLVERLLSLGQQVTGLDNLATGHRQNVDDAVRGAAGFRFVEGDIRDLDVCRSACEGVDVVLHQAAMGSVPRSIKDPATSHGANVDGTFNMLLGARDAGAWRFVFASSSSVYGDDPGLPKVESRIGRQLSPYAITKRVGELYAQIFSETYGLETIGLRYFNVFGRRQDPNGVYSAVIPRWIAALLKGETCTIFGDGETSRDFSYVANVVDANILAAVAPRESTNRIYNIACGGKTTLTQLYRLVRERLVPFQPQLAGLEPKYEPFRRGDIRDSEADISAAVAHLGYAPTHTVAAGLDQTMAWYVALARSEMTV